MNLRKKLLLLAIPTLLSGPVLLSSMQGCTTPNNSSGPKKATKTATGTPTITSSPTTTPTITATSTITDTPTVTATATACGNQGTMGDQPGSSGYVGQYATVLYWSLFNLSSTNSNPVLKDIQAKLYTANQTLNYEVGIYDQVAGAPKNLLGSSGVIPVNNGSGIPSTLFNIPGNVTLTNGANYYLVVLYYNDVGIGPGVAYDASGSNQFNSYASGSSLPSTFSGTLSGPNSGTFAIYADFCQ